MNFLLDEIKNQPDTLDAEKVKSRIKQIGNSTTDLYTGNLSIKVISNYCIAELKKKHLFQKDTYLNWLHRSPELYQSLDYPDSSIWILKIGIEEGRHIHIHPGRNVPHTLRVKANILKMAFLSNLYARKEKVSPFNIDLINFLRHEMLGLSPIKFVTMNHDLGKMIFLFGNKLGTLK
jgi:hypothetical protein